MYAIRKSKSFFKYCFSDNPNLTLDLHYYLTSQIHPVVSRLIEPLEGIDRSSIAEALGLNPANYAKQNTAAGGSGENGFDGDEDSEAMLGAGSVVKWSDCLALQLACPHCGADMEPLSSVPWKAVGIADSNKSDGRIWKVKIVLSPFLFVLTGWRLSLCLINQFIYLFQEHFQEYK